MEESSAKAFATILVIIITMVLFLLVGSIWFGFSNPPPVWFLWLTMSIVVLESCVFFYFAAVLTVGFVRAYFAHEKAGNKW